METPTEKRSNRGPQKSSFFFFYKFLVYHQQERQLYFSLSLTSTLENKKKKKPFGWILFSFVVPSPSAVKRALSFSWVERDSSFLSFQSFLFFRLVSLGLSHRPQCTHTHTDGLFFLPLKDIKSKKPQVKINQKPFGPNRDNGISMAPKCTI